MAQLLCLAPNRYRNWSRHFLFSLFLFSLSRLILFNFSFFLNDFSSIRVLLLNHYSLLGLIFTLFTFSFLLFLCLFYLFLLSIFTIFIVFSLIFNFLLDLLSCLFSVFSFIGFISLISINFSFVMFVLSR